MKILQTIAGLNILSGGPSRSTYQLVKGMNELGGEVDLCTILPKKTCDGNTGDNETWIYALPSDTITPLSLSKNMKSFLLNSNYDLYNTNGLWLYCNHITCKIARKKNKPYIITPRGMLYPDALKRSAWKKMLTRKLWFDKDILNASCIHATCSEEAKYIRDFGYKGPIAIIGNVVEIPEFAKLAVQKPNGKKKLGYLGRLHPRKHVEYVIEAISKLPNEIKENLTFQIMGKGVDGYELFLKTLVKNNKLEKIVDFVGFVDGEEKYKKLRDLSVLFVPSDFENFGMIIPEALISGTPVMASLGTPWQSLNETKSGWWVDATVDNIQKIITDVVNMPESEILEMGARGRKMVEDNFSSNIIATKMLQLYSWIIKGGDKPKFVI